MAKDHVPALDPFPGAKGRVTVALNNAETGALEAEYVQDNFVSPRWLDSMRRGMNWNHFSFSSSGTGKNLGSLANITPLSQLLLTDYAEEPAPDEEWIWKGNAAGWCLLNNSSSSTYVGTYNSTESFQTTTAIRFVADFATNQANGPFQSVYMTPLTSVGNFTGATVGPSPSSFGVGGVPSRSPGNYRLWCGMYSDSVVYFQSVTGGGFGIRTYREDIDARIAGNTVPAQVVPTPADNGVRGAWVEGSNVYTVWGQTASATRFAVYRSPRNNLEDYTKVFEFSDAWLASLGGSGGSWFTFRCTYDEEMDKYLVGGVPGLSGITIVLNKDFTEDSRYSGGQTPSALYVPRSGYVRFGPSSTMFYLDPVSGTHVPVLDGSASGSAAPLALNGPVGYWNMSGGTIHMGTTSLIFSRALLPAPVQKTSQQTMKITYDFTFDDQFAWPPQ